MAISLSTIMDRLSRKRRAKIEARAVQLATEAEPGDQARPRESPIRPANPKETRSPK